VIREILALVPGAQGALQNEIWKKHREALRAPAAVPAIGAAHSEHQPPEKTASVPEIFPSVDERPNATLDDETPEWARSIENLRFRKALLHIYTHGLLNETELVNLVGGPRQARAFARQLDEWLNVLPFRVEVRHVGETKLYRNVGPR
jgi:hypothetical protein